MKPRSRRTAALILLVLTLVATGLDCWLFTAHKLTDRVMLFQTLILSWLAITFTCLDIWATTDVRANDAD